MDIPLPLKGHLLSGGAWALGGLVITAVTGLVVNVLLARLLNPEELGAYFIIVSLISVATLLAQLGMNYTVVRLVAESLGKGQLRLARIAVLSVLRYGALGAFVVAGILNLGLGQWLAHRIFNSTLIGEMVGLAAVWVVVATFQNLMAESFRGFHDIRLASIFGGSVSFGGPFTIAISTIILALLWVIKGHSNLAQVLISFIVAGFISALIAGLWLGGKLRFMEGDGNLQTREIWAMAWPLLITNLTLFVITQADIWVLGSFRSQEEVAIYGAAFRLAMLVSMPLIIVNAVMPPLIADMYAQGKRAELERTLRMTATLSGIPALMVVLIFAAFGSPILELVYGGYYREGAVVLALISIGQLVNVWAGSCGFTLIMTGNQVTTMGITVVCGFLTIAGALWLVKDYGAFGVASVAATTMILQNFLMLLFAKKKTGMWTHARLSFLNKQQ